MLHTLFPRVSRKYLELPLFGPVMNAFSEWLLEQGYRRSCCRLVINLVQRIDKHLRRHGIRRIADLTAVDLRRYWKTLRRRIPWQAGTVRILERFLVAQGLIKPDAPCRTLQLAEFSEYLREVRNLAPDTIEAQLQTITQFFAHLGLDDGEKRLTRIALEDIEDFIREISKSLGRATLKGRVTHLRNYLRFLAMNGKISPVLADQIPTPRCYEFEKLPRALPWKTVQAFLHSIPRTTISGQRDYVIFFLMATYGFRTCEIASLTLDDLDWRARSIRISQTKTRNVFYLPMTDEAAHVLVDYLRRVSRPTGYRNLFFRVRAPIGPVTAMAVKDAFVRWSTRSRLDIPFRGPHCIRHSFAVHLLRQGTSLKSIGDLLGHRCPQSTSTYIRLATDELRKVGLSVPQPIREKGRVS